MTRRATAWRSAARALARRAGRLPLAALRRVALAVLGLAGSAPTVLADDAGTPPAISRLDEIRSRLQAHDASVTCDDGALDPATPPGADPSLAQWFNWPNWANWSKWNNWGNWNNWANWGKY